MILWIFRFIILALLATAGYFFPFFSLRPEVSAAAAGVLALGIMVLEIRIRKAQFKAVWAPAAGALTGVVLGWGLGAIYNSISSDRPTAVFIRVFFLVITPYIGFLLGWRKPDGLNPARLLGLFREKGVGRSTKILDTSVIIDGRITDLCDTAFVEGPLIVPQFILRELQLVADSADALKRQRGRRGLDVLDHLQKSSQVSVVISDLDFPDVRDVDSKVIEMAKRLEAKIVTNDLNLNKVARLQGISVLNINELANALKPIVLPGETMRVYILKEGKEKDQGVAYLDDGTMVVVDNSRKMIGQNIDVTVTSVLQTTVGKMIFGRYNQN
ncbi:MAG: TRAM domain-containing protein [Candidatus Aminicenantes bacterium]|nr:TRAM domain-containing protein [Candidatus Aminicenantes bacterium]